LFSDAESGFKKCLLTDKSLELFFKTNTTVIPVSTQLLKLLWAKCVACSFENDREYKELNPENLSIVIGAFANSSVLIDEYNEFIRQCFAEVSIFDKFDYELRIKMAIRALNQSRMFTQSIETSFKMLKNINNSLAASIENVFASKNYNAGNFRVPDENTFEVINYFHDIDTDDLNSSLEDVMSLYDDQIEKYKNKSKIITNHLIKCLIEYYNPKVHMDFVDDVFQCLVQRVEFNELQTMIKDIKESDFLKDLAIDAPNSIKVWSKVEEFFE